MRKFIITEEEKLEFLKTFKYFVQKLFFQQYFQITVYIKNFQTQRKA